MVLHHRRVFHRQIAVLRFGFGMHVEFDGAGGPHLRFGAQDAVYAKLEEHRAQQPAATPVEEPKKEPAIELPPDAGPYWTDFRGPGRAGAYTQTPIVTTWPAEGLKPIWKQPIGGGYASFVIAKRRVYTIEQRRDKEAVTAYDAATGKELWVHSYKALFSEGMGGDGPRATPTFDDGVIYSLGATGELYCLDAATGKVKWNKNILTEGGADNLQWGVSGAPLVVDNMLIVQPGGKDGSSVVALNKKNGETIWKSLPDRQAYTSPMVLTVAGQRQIVTVTAARAVGLNPADGKLLWEFPWVTEYDVNAAQPIQTGDDTLFLSAGYGHGAALLKIAKDADAFKADAVWQNTKMKNKFSSSVLRDGYIYGFDEAIFACIDAKTGDLKWKGGRYGTGQVILAGEHLIVLSEAGELVLLKASPDAHSEVAKFQAIAGKTWNIPAIDNGILYIRNGAEMAAYVIAPLAEPVAAPPANPPSK